MGDAEQTPVRVKRKTPAIDLDTISEEALLQVRICDLPLAIEGTWLEECVGQLCTELKEKGIIFKPACYLADEWLTPENEPVIGIPFYLTHPALIKLEKKMMLEAEGETREWCMRLLRHEMGHAICYAYRLSRKKKWKEIFGSPKEEYADTYRFRPYSKNFVRHLEGFYAQYHPDEDFVETFAVWLTPNLDWEKTYAGWPVLKKLRYVDALMQDIKGKAPVVSKGEAFWHVKRLTVTLKNFYYKKRYLRAEDFPDFHDENLKNIFSDRTEENKTSPAAGELIKKYKRTLLEQVSLWTGEKKYVINDLVKTIDQRCQELKLAASAPEPVVLSRLCTYITTLVMNYLYTGWFRGDKKKRKKA